ncbi:MAG: DUF3530 family protein [Motiliproteus sp.]
MNNAKDLLKIPFHQLGRQLLIAAAILLTLTAGQPALAADPENKATETPTGTPTPTQNKPGGRVLPKPEQQQLAQLAKEKLPNTEILWLETQHESFLGLLHPAISGEPLGGVLILHHDRTSPDWPELIHGLRAGLPRQGWHTLSIATPEMPKPAFPKRGEETASTAQASDNEAATKAFAEKIFERIEAGLNKLQSLDAKRFVVLGVGTSGYWASRYAAEAGAQRPLNLTLVDALSPSIKVEPTFATLVASLKTPTLDLYHGSGLKKSPTLRSSIETAASQRMDEARRQQRQNYLQRRLPIAAPISGVSDQRLLSTFKGLFEKHLKQLQPSADAAKNPCGANTAK